MAQVRWHVFVCERFASIERCLFAFQPVWLTRRNWNHSSEPVFLVDIASSRTRFNLLRAQQLTMIYLNLAFLIVRSAVNARRSMITDYDHRWHCWYGFASLDEGERLATTLFPSEIHNLPWAHCHSLWVWRLKVLTDETFLLGAIIRSGVIHFASTVILHLTKRQKQ